MSGTAKLVMAPNHIKTIRMDCTPKYNAVTGRDNPQMHASGCVSGSFHRQWANISCDFILWTLKNADKKIVVFDRAVLAQADGSASDLHAPPPLHNVES